MSGEQSGVRGQQDVRAWQRHPVVAGTVAAVVTAVIGITTILLVAAALDGDDASASGPTGHGPATTHTRPATRRSTTTTTTTAPASTTTTAPAGGSLPATGGSATPATTPAATDAPDDTPDPPIPADAFHPGAVAPGIQVTTSTCTWSGGRLRAAGTLSYTGTEDKFWILTVSWVVNNQGQDEELDFETETYDVGPGQSTGWDLSTTSPTPPPNLSCSVAVD